MGLHLIVFEEVLFEACFLLYASFHRRIRWHARSIVEDSYGLQHVWPMICSYRGRDIVIYIDFPG